MSFITKLFDTTGYPPRWHCGTWTGFEGYLHIFSDVAIWGAYFAIPVLLLVVLWKKKDIPFPKIFLLFAAFIVSCGATHLFDAMIFYYPMYRFLGVIKLVTACVSWATVIYLFTKMKLILKMLTPDQIKDKSIKQISDAMPQIVWSHTAAGVPDYFNEKFYELTGADREGDFQKIWSPVIFPDDRIIIIEANQISLETGSDYQVEIRLRIKNEFRWHLVRCVAVRSNSHIDRFVGTCTDIHEIKVLEKSVEERTEQLMLTNKELEMFAYVASHDLQDPLRRMGAFLKIMFTKIPQTAETEEYKQIVLEANESMKKMTSNLLEYARDANKVIDLKECDMGKIVSKTVETLAHHVQASNATITVKELPGKVFCDEPQIQRVWQNLLRNSIKYRREVDPVIEVGYVDEKDKYRFYVKDNGEGINTVDIDKLFVVFRRLRKDDRGVGFGLAICKKIVEKHGGEIWVESEKGVGSTFFFTLPKSGSVPTEHPEEDHKDKSNNNAAHLEGKNGVGEKKQTAAVNNPKEKPGLPKP